MYCTCAIWNQIDIHDRDGVHVPWNEQTLKLNPSLLGRRVRIRPEKQHREIYTYICMFLSAEIDD